MTTRNAPLPIGLPINCHVNFQIFDESSILNFRVDRILNSLELHGLRDIILPRNKFENYTEFGYNVSMCIGITGGLAKRLD